ncbi:MAG: thermonuclease family protein [Synechococcaceae cyanobacterium]|jgi:endonuclease YncB( thermonuclease family)|nr:thermonuclease family protein [Synechococcaceae cyanobacterium]
MAFRWLTLLLVLVAALPAAGGTPTLKVEVISIGDGDTIHVRQAERDITVRLACIDAPEKAQRPWGQQARDSLMQRLSRGREVSIHPHATDRYGRLVAEVFSDVNVGLAMVEGGQAFAYRRYLNGCAAKGYLDAEFRASQRHHGVWQLDGGITRPWDFRRSRRSHSEARPPRRHVNSHRDGVARK